MHCPRATTLWLLLSAMAWSAYGGEAQTDEKARKGQFLRLVRDDEGSPLSLEAAVVHCVPSEQHRTSPTVDLISAVHVAEKGY